MTSNAIAIQTRQLREDLLSRDTIFDAAPEYLRKEGGKKRFLELAVRSVHRNPMLLDCSKGSLFTAIAEAASLGLELGGVLGQAYLVPFKGQAQLVPGYLGLKELAYRGGKVAVIDSGVVREGDYFSYELGTEMHLRHRPADTPGAPVTHVWALAKLTSGEYLVRVMTHKQVEQHRDKFSKGAGRGDSPWRSSFELMAQKTVLRSLYKLLPLSAEVQTLTQREEYIEASMARVTTLQSGDTAPAEELDALAEEPEHIYDEPTEEKQ